MGAKIFFSNKRDNLVDVSKVNPMKKGVVILDSKKRRTGDGPDHGGPTGNTELYMGLDEIILDVMDKGQTKFQY